MTPVGSYHTLDDLPLEDHRILVRVDINSPVDDDGRIIASDRLKAHAETLSHLAGEDARVVVLAHQGRKGGPDFTSLQQHAERLDELVDAPVHFVPDVVGDDALAAIRDLEPGHVLLLDNVRGLHGENQQGTPEQMCKADYVRTLAEVVDLYANDAFSAAHRSQPSLVGFPPLLPSAAGLIMDRELTALARAVKDPNHPNVYVLGGAKVDDAMDVMERNFENGTLDRVLLGGLVGELFLMAAGHDLGEAKTTFLRERGILDHRDRAAALLAAYGDRLDLPVDVGVETPEGRVDVPVADLPMEGRILDVGPDTVKHHASILQGAGSIFMNGPVGLYEEEAFRQGTRGVLEAIRVSDAFSVLGGGHTVMALAKCGMDRGDFGYVSLAGGALLAYVTGRDLPAVEALEASHETVPIPTA